MRARAKRERDSEMTTIRGEGGGATEAAITRNPLHVLPALSLGGDLWLCSPHLFLYVPHSLSPPLSLLSRRGTARWLGDTSFPSLDYSRGANDSGLWNIKEWGCNNEELGISLRDTSSRPHSQPAPGANLGSDHEVLVILIVKIPVLRLQRSTDPTCGSAPSWLPVVQIQAMCNYFPSWGYTIIDQSWAPSTLLPLLFILWRNPSSWLYHLTLITHHTLIKLLGTFIITSARRRLVYKVEPCA